MCAVLIYYRYRPVLPSLSGRSDRIEASDREGTVAVYSAMMMIAITNANDRTYHLVYSDSMCAPKIPQSIVVFADIFRYHHESSGKVEESERGRDKARERKQTGKRIDGSDITRTKFAIALFTLS